MEISESLELPKKPGLPCRLPCSWTASIVQAAGSGSPRGQTLPRSSAAAAVPAAAGRVRASNLIVYQRPASHGNGIVLEKWVATCGGQLRTCNCWLAPIRSSVYRWAISPMSGMRAFSRAAGLPKAFAKASASEPEAEAEEVGDGCVSDAGEPGFSTPVSWARKSALMQ